MLIDQCYAQALYHCYNILAHFFVHQYAELLSVSSQSAMLLTINSLIARMLNSCPGVLQLSDHLSVCILKSTRTNLIGTQKTSAG